jgi:sugar phosphate isomerase/epimerase
VNPGILRESFRQLENIIKWADVMPFEIFVLHAGTTPSDIPQVRNIVRDIIYRSMEDIKKVAQKKEVEIVIENTGISDRYWDRDVKNLITLMDDFELGLCLDIGHINLCRDPEGEYRALEKYIKHIHISDNNKTNDDHFPVGEGAIDYSIYNGMLRKFNGLTVHEIHAPADPAEAILRSRDNLNKILVKNVSRETFKRTKDDV